MRIDRFDVLAVIGVILLLVGLALFDWRLALVASGLIVLLSGVAGAALRPRRRR